MTYYLDASAAVKLVKPEKETPGLLKFLGFEESNFQPGRFISSDLLRTELIGTVLRAGLSTAVGLRVLDAVVLFRLSPQICEAAGNLVGKLDIRSLDALHLATAVSQRTQLAGLLTYDHKLAAAAESLGLLVESPA
jgi:predicted nucleic acid-binding protein